MGSVYSRRPTNLKLAPVAQLEEQIPSKDKVGSSNLSGGTMKNKLTKRNFNSYQQLLLGRDPWGRYKYDVGKTAYEFAKQFQDYWGLTLKNSKKS